jgi:hypothetical protein
MSERFLDKYRIPSARMQNWDYGWNAAYLVTICTQAHDCYFGDIIPNGMILSETMNRINVFRNIFKRIRQIGTLINFIRRSCRHRHRCRDAINRVSTSHIASLRLAL